MAKSMTGFGRAVGVVNGREIRVEIRAVNSKYLDLTVKLPKNCGAFEGKIKTYIEKSGISRGKVDVYLSINDIDASSVSVELDRAYARSYINALYSLRDEFSLKDDISVMSVAANQLVFTALANEIDYDSLWEDVTGVLEDAVTMFIEARAKEGERIANDLLAKKDELEKMRLELLERSKHYVSDYRARLEEKLREILAERSVVADENRILTECAIYADKTAIDEELVRLSIHMKAFEEMFRQDEPIGRKLDFLLQEFNREINTSGSKCSDAESTAIVVNMKTLTEKIREQVQNLE